MERVIDIEIPPQSRYLALVRRAVASAAPLHRVLPDRRVDDLSLAVSEACANAIDAEVALGRSDALQVRVELLEAAVAVTVTDHGGGFTPEDVDPVPAADDPGRLRHERGLGLPLMRNLVDELSFERTDDGTSVTLRVDASA